MHLAGILLLLATVGAPDADAAFPLAYRISAAEGFPGWRRVEVTVENKTSGILAGATELEVGSMMGAQRESYEGASMIVAPGEKGEAVFLVPPTQGAKVQFHMTTVDGISVPWTSSQFLGYGMNVANPPMILFSDDPRFRARMMRLGGTIIQRQGLTRFRQDHVYAANLLIDASLLEDVSDAWADTILAWSKNIPVTIIASGGSLRGLRHALIRDAFGLAPERTTLLDGVGVVVFRTLDASRARILVSDSNLPLLYHANGPSNLHLLPFEPTRSENERLVEATTTAIPPLQSLASGGGGAASPATEGLLEGLAPEVPIRHLLLLLLAYVVAVPVLFFAIARFRAEARTWVLIPALAIGVAVVLLAWARVGPGSENLLAGTDIEVREEDGTVRRHLRLALYAGGGFRGEVALPGDGAGTLSEFDVPGNAPSRVLVAASGRTVDLAVPPRAGAVLEAVGRASEAALSAPETSRLFDAATGRWTRPDGTSGDIPRFDNAADSTLLPFLEASLRAGGSSRYRVGIVSAPPSYLPAGFLDRGFIRIVAVGERGEGE